MFDIDDLKIKQLDFIKSTSDQIKEYRKTPGLSYSLLKHVPNFIETKRAYEQDRWTESMSFGDLVDRMLFLEDWQDVVKIIDNPTVDMSIIRGLKKLKDQEGEINEQNFARFFREATGKFNSYKDKTLYEKYYKEKFEPYLEQFTRDDIIFISKQDIERAYEAINSITNNPVVYDMLYGKEIYTQVPLYVTINTDREYKLKGLLDILAIDKEEIIIADLKVSSDPFRNIYRQKWVLQGAFYTFLWINSILQSDDINYKESVISKLSKFIWIVYNPEIKNTYVFKVDINEKEPFYVDKFSEYADTGIESSSPFLQYILGDKSSNVMSIYERISILQQYIDDGFKTDPRSQQPIDIAPIPPYNLGI